MRPRYSYITFDTCRQFELTRMSRSSNRRFPGGHHCAGEGDAPHGAAREAASGGAPLYATEARRIGICFRRKKKGFWIFAIWFCDDFLGKAENLKI